MKQLLTRSTKKVLALVAACLTLVLFNNCSQNFKVSKNFATGSISQGSNAIDPVTFDKGRTLYVNNCASCHGDLGASTKINSRADQISSALKNVSSMMSLQSKLTSEEIALIAKVLDSKTRIDQPLTCSDENIGKSTVRRLNAREILNSLRDLLGSHNLVMADLPVDAMGSAGYDTEYSATSTTSVDIVKLVTAFEKAVDYALSQPSLSLNSCFSSTGAQLTSCLQTLVQKKAQLAYKGVITAQETQTLTSVLTTGSDAKEGLRLALLRMLVAPKFLFHYVDYSVNKTNTLHQLSSYELASRLSFFLWSSLPDVELLNLAAAGTLSQPEILRVQIQRMLKDSKSTEFMTQFPSQWLGYKNLPTNPRSSTSNPEYTPALKNAMFKETNQLFYLNAQNNLPLDQLLTTKTSYMNRDLANFYGVAFPQTTSEYTNVSLAGSNRKGILTLGAVLQSTATSDSTDPIRRGKMILKKVNCETLGSPPPAVGTLEEIESGLNIRQTLAAHQRNPSCAACHSRMDPLGLAFENFNSVGKWRTMDGVHPVEPAGELLSGFKFNTAEELVENLAVGAQFEQCFVKQVSMYAFGRELTPAEKCFTDSLVSQFPSQQQMTLNSLVEALVLSPYFKTSQVRE